MRSILQLTSFPFFSFSSSEEVLDSELGIRREDLAVLSRSFEKGEDAVQNEIESRDSEPSTKLFD